MKIRMNTLMAGPHGARHPGEVCVVAADEAEMLVKQGYADYAESVEVEAEAEKTAEVAVEAEAEAESKPSEKSKGKGK